jgi:MFS family permease
MHDRPTASDRVPSTPSSNNSTALDGNTPRSALLVVFLVVFIDLLGFGLVLPLLPRYADAMVQGEDSAAGGPARDPFGGLVIGLAYAAFSAMQFVFAPIWGSWSDRVGRRPILLLGLAGSVVFYSLFGIASSLPTDPEWRWIGLTLLFASRLGAGAFCATIPTAQAVIADTTTPDRRSRGMALIGAAFGIGFTFGPLIGLAALELWPNQPGGPGFLAAGLSFLALLLGLRLLPETLPALDKPRIQRGFQLGRFLQVLRDPNVGFLVFLFAVTTFAFANFETTLSLLTRDVLGYANRPNFFVFAFVGVTLLITQGFLYQRLARRGVREATFVSLGLTFLMLGMAALGGLALLVGTDAARSWGPPILFGALLAEVVGFAFVTPSLQSLISRRSDSRRQGEILGVNQSAGALARIVGPIVGLTLFKSWDAPVLPYALGFLLLAVLWTRLLVVPLDPPDAEHRRKEETNHALVANDEPERASPA